jgi:hypothetical protein
MTQAVTWYLLNPETATAATSLLRKVRELGHVNRLAERERMDSDSQTRNWLTKIHRPDGKMKVLDDSYFTSYGLPKV